MTLEEIIRSVLGKSIGEPQPLKIRAQRIGVMRTAGFAVTDDGIITNTPEAVVAALRMCVEGDTRPWRILLRGERDRAIENLDAAEARIPEQLVRIGEMRTTIETISISEAP